MFPLEWLLVENIRNHEHLNISSECWEKLHSSFLRVFEAELANRELIEDKIQNHPAMIGATVVLMRHRDLVDEDRYQCKYCTDLPYLSVVTCVNCKINYCTSHDLQCGCSDVKVVYRYTTEVCSSSF